jgi:predicted metal-dependent hydrolase
MTSFAAREPRFARAVAEFNARHYYEAHELWEVLWAEEVGDLRICLQALVQAAAGYHKAEIGVTNGARKLWTSSLRLLEGQADDSCGIDVAKLRMALRGALQDANVLMPPIIEVRE